MPLPAFLIGGAAIAGVIFFKNRANKIADKGIACGAKELDARLMIFKKYIALTTRGIVILGILLFFIILTPIWLSLVFFIFSAVFILIDILMFTNYLREYRKYLKNLLKECHKDSRKDSRVNLRLFMKYLRLHNFNLHSTIVVFIDVLAHRKVSAGVDEKLDENPLKSVLADVFVYSRPCIISKIFRKSNYKELRNSILLYFYCLMFLIPLVLYLIALAWSEYGFW